MGNHNRLYLGLAGFKIDRVPHITNVQTEMSLDFDWHDMKVKTLLEPKKPLLFYILASHISYWA